MGPAREARMLPVSSTKVRSTLVEALALEPG
jgi:hypothetical protein